MANVDAGSLRFNTKLDNEGFEKGSSRLQQALQSLRDKIWSVSGSLNSAFEFTKIRSGLQDTARSMQEFRDDVEDIAKTMASVDTADTYIQAQDALDELSKKIAEVRDREYQLEQGTVKGSQTEQYHRMIEAYVQLKDKIDAADESQKSTIGNYQDMAYFAQKFQETAGSMDAAVSLEQTSDVVAEMRRQMEEFGNMDFTFGGKLMKGTDTAGFKEMKTAVEAAEQKLEEMAHSPAWNEMAQKWSTMPTLSGMVKNTVTGALSAIATKATQTSFVLYAAIHDPLGALDRMAAAITASASRAAVGIAKIGSGPAIAGLKSIGNGAKNAAGHLAEMAKNAAVAPFKRLGDALSSVFNKSSDGLKLGFGSILKYALGILSLKTILGSLKSAATEGFSNLLQYDNTLATTVNSFKASLDTLKNSLGAAFAPIAQVVLPILTRMINALSVAISYVGMFIAALTGQSTFKRAVAQQGAAADAANGAADAYKNEAKQAKKAEKTVASFDELHQLNDNSDSGGGGGGAPGGGGGGIGGAAFEDVPIESKIDDLAKKLKEMWDLADFTELGRKLGEGLKNLLDSIPWDLIKAVAQKLGKSIATFLNGFLEVPGLFYTIGKTIAEGINTIFELLNAFVNNFHFDSLGYAIKDAILGLLDNLDWPLIYDTFSKAGIGLGQTIEAAFDNPEIWTAIFEGLSHQWEALLLFIDGLISTPNWGSIAANIGTGLNAGVEAFPWDLLSQTLADALNMVFDFAYNFLTTFDFFKFGQHIGTSLTNAIGGVDWSTGGAALGAAINALYDVINGFIESTDWGLLGSSVINFIGGFFATVDTGKWGEYAGNVLTALFDFLSSAIEEIDWVAVPGIIIGKIGDFLSGVNWTEVADSAMRLLGDALGAAFGIVVGLLIAAGGAIYEGFKNIIDGGLQGIIDALANIGGWIVEHIFTPFINGFKAAFGIASPAKEMEPLGDNIMAGMGQGIISWISGIPGWLAEHVGGPIIKGVKDLFGIGSGDPALKESGEGTIEGMKTGMTNALSNAASWVKGNITDKILNPVKEGFGISGSDSTVFNGYGGQMTDGLKSGISGGTKDMQSFIGTNVTDTVLNPINSGFGISGSEARILSDIGRFMTESLRNAIQSGSTDLLSIVTNIASGMLEVFNNIDWDNVGDFICKGIHNGLDAGWSWLTDTAWNLACDILDAAKRALGINSPSKEFAWIGEMLTAGLANGMDDTADVAVSSAEALAEAVTAGAETAKPSVSVDTVTDGIDDVLSVFADKVTGGFAAMIARMEEIAAGSSFYVPAAASGALAPYSARQGSSGAGTDVLTDILDKVTQANTGRLTRSDLKEILAEVISEYMDIDFYIGDEQVARSANRGNERINRRYHPVDNS